MNRTLIFTLIRNRLSSPARLALMGVSTLWVLPIAAFGHSLQPIAGAAGFFGILCAAGAIGQDLSSGTLQLVFARPVTRPEYVMSRWVACGLLASAWTIAALVVGYAVIAGSGTPPAPMDLVRFAVEGICEAFGGAALVIMFSSLAGGLADVGLLIGSIALCGALGQVAQHYDWTFVSAVMKQVNSSFVLTMPLDWVVQHAAPPWRVIATYASTVSIALSVAILRINRRELSYAGNA